MKARWVATASMPSKQTRQHENGKYLGLLISRW
ncbi:hypothetical protein TGAM01_v201138 [Trichoderma gamsii]|uniref:Uncharacterized protein n=1 Tax=Trichoderma gamsii TaxID=398673 RepID=A0A2P4ZZQ5_9HYPO|nr:hypothetical protein TGAM01_v201138 [Trichoderma gamsii]PON29772.1 hypothetical protein TGAM01_v201138 [Trichoderma gamsii]